MKIDVDPVGFHSAAAALRSARNATSSAYSSLTSSLGGSGAMGGNDSSSADFVSNYDPAATELCGALADLGTGFGSLAGLSATTGDNHRDADAASVYRGSSDAASGDSTAEDSGTVSPYNPPSALGGDSGDMPDGWDMVVDHLQGWTWPSADTARLRQAASAWRAMATGLDRTPGLCDVATGHIELQRSPEISPALRAIAEIRGHAYDLAAECRNLAESCEEYAEKVETTKEVVKGLIRDLLIEIGITAGIGVVGSFVTFGGAGAAAAAVITARAISVARKIIHALQGIRAIRAIGTLARSLSKVTVVRSALRRFRSARNLKHKPSGKIPPKGKPGSYGYDKTGTRMPYANGRPKLKQENVNTVWRRQMDDGGDVFVRNKDGDLVKIDWKPGEPRKGVWDMGHIPGQEYRRLEDDYLSGRMNKEEFLRRFHNPDNYEVLNIGRNRSHMDEVP